MFGVLFAINSSLHSYLIVSYASEDGVSLDVGFYYMANALGRLLGTVLSGWVFQAGGTGRLPGDVGAVRRAGGADFAGAAAACRAGVERTIARASAVHLPPRADGCGSAGP